MISVEEREEARITPVVLSFQQGLQLSPGKCRFFPSGRAVHPTQLPPGWGCSSELGSFWKPLVLKLLLICASFGGFIGAFKGFFCDLSLGKGNSKQPPQKPHSGCAYKYKMVSGNLPLKSKIIPNQNLSRPISVTHIINFLLFIKFYFLYFIQSKHQKDPKPFNFLGKRK